MLNIPKTTATTMRAHREQQLTALESLGKSRGQLPTIDTNGEISDNCARGQTARGALSIRHTSSLHIVCILLEVTKVVLPDPASAQRVAVASIATNIGARNTQHLHCFMGVWPTGIHRTSKVVCSKRSTDRCDE